MTANREGAGGLGALAAGDDGFLYPPQALAYCAALLRQQAFKVRICDAAGERLNTAAALASVSARATDVIAVLVAYASLDDDITFLTSLRRAVPKARLLAIGNSVSLIAPSLLERSEVDHVLIGEPEAILLPACQAIAGKASVRRTVRAADIAAAGANGEGRVADLDSLPRPLWDLLPWQRYGFLTIAASRGCDEFCTFCPYVIGQGRYVRARDPLLVAQEMAWLAATYRPARVIVRDPVFAHERARVERLCRELIAQRVKLAWECESRPEHFDASLLALLKQAGCTTIKLGFETTSERVLRNLRRIPPDGSASAYVEQTARVVAACRSVGLACRLFVMTGLPGQTDADIAETIAFLRNVRPTQTHVKAFTRYPTLPMPLADPDEERRRGERQERVLHEALRTMPRPAAPGALHRLGRWLRRRIGR